MHLTVRAKDLARILSTVRPAVATRSTIPILSMILLEARDGTVTASACTLDTLAMDHAPATVVEAGAHAFPAEALTAIVKSLPAEAEVTLHPTEGDSRITVASGRTRARLAVLSRDDFPLYDHATPFSGALPVDVLRRIIVDTQFANNCDESRWYLRGVHLAAVNGKLQASSTDGHRALRIATELPAGLADMPAVIVPRDAQGAIAKILDGADGEVTVGISSERIRIVTGSRLFASKLVDGKYPDIDRFFPVTGGRHTADVDRDDLANALRRVLAINDDKMPLVPITFAEGELRLRARGQNHDTADAIDADVAGGEVEIGINGRYLLEQLAVMSANTVALESEGPTAPWRIIDEGSADLHSIAPMRV
jgi:DNA polymerase-3 subunit beta